MSRKESADNSRPFTSYSDTPARRSDAIYDIRTGIAEVADLIEAGNRAPMPPAYPPGDQEFNIEVSVDLDGVRESVQGGFGELRDELASSSEAAWHAYDQLSVVQHTLGEELPVVRARLEDMTDLMRSQLGLTATGLGAMALLHKGVGAGAELVASRTERALARLGDDLGDRLEEIACANGEMIAQAADHIAQMLTEEMRAVQSALRTQTGQLLRAVEWQTATITSAIEAASDRNHEDVKSLERAVREGSASRLALEAEERFCDAQTNFEMREYRRALTDARKALDAKSTHIGTWVLLGRLAEVYGQNTRAVRAYCRAVELSKLAKDYTYLDAALLLLMDLERRQGNLKNCLPFVQRAILPASAGIIVPEAALEYLRLSTIVEGRGGLTDGFLLKSLLDREDLYWKFAKDPILAEFREQWCPDVVKFGPYGVFLWYVETVIHRLEALAGESWVAHEDGHWDDLVRDDERLLHLPPDRVGNWVYDHLGAFRSYVKTHPWERDSRLWSTGVAVLRLQKRLLRSEKMLAEFLAAEEHSYHALSYRRVFDQSHREMVRDAYRAG